ncbi:MAG: hypothetical protein KJO07_19795 [Deltaproteobacteria bacterium]|nr:hypothetical protein [Deltaproteobacteria bacterium]
MKTKSLIRKIEHFLSKKKRKQLKKYDSLLKVLRKLKKKEASLQAKLDKQTDKDHRKELKHKLEVIALQRKKGLLLKKKLEKARNGD